MGSLRADIEDALAVFLSAAHLAGVSLAADALEVEYLPAPHRPPSRLPAGRMAVYGFWARGRWLKIGRAGPHSAARFTSHHYRVNGAQSTLAASLAADPRVRTLPRFDPADPGAWIKANASRVNILLDAAADPALLAYLEAFLHLRLHPYYESGRRPLLDSMNPDWIVEVRPAPWTLSYRDGSDEWLVQDMDGLMQHFVQAGLSDLQGALDEFLRSDLAREMPAKLAAELLASGVVQDPPTWMLAGVDRQP